MPAGQPTSSHPPRNWNAASYDRVAAPVIGLGLGVLDRLELRGDEYVLDAGCGSGRVTEALLERLPRGRVIAVDGSPTMVERARARLGDRARVERSDLLELELDERVDVIFSTATFHWILDHPRLFARLHAALRPRGRLVAQCGGAGNIARFLESVDAVIAEQPFAPYFAGWSGPWRYAAPAQARADLERTGFRGARCWLQDAPVTTEHPHEYIETVMLGGHVDRLPAELRKRFVAAVVARLPRPVTVDYVRLNIDAIA